MNRNIRHLPELVNMDGPRSRTLHCCICSIVASAAKDNRNNEKQSANCIY